MNAPQNTGGLHEVSPSGSRQGNKMLQKNAPTRRRTRSKGSGSGFPSMSDEPSHNDTPPPAPSNLSENGSLASDSSKQPQNATDAAVHPPPLKPCHSAKLALVCVQNASQMGARTQLNLCPPGKARDDLLKTLQMKRRRKKTLPAPAAIRRSLSFQRASSIASVGSRSEEVSAFEKIVGESGVAEYDREEEKFLSNPELDSVGLNSDGEEIQEDPSSGDDDELDFLFDEEESLTSPKGADGISNETDEVELLYTLGSETMTNNHGSAGSGKIAFNFRKIKWFDAVTATDRATARQYLKKEISSMKKNDLIILTNHLKKAQRREKRRMEVESGRRGSMTSISDKLYQEDDDDDMNFSGISNLPSPMTPSLSAAMILESLSLNPLESLEGMSKCYEGIVAAGSAILDAKIDDPAVEKKKHSKEEIISALAPLLITTLEQAAGDTILALARLRKMCGTKRYQRRFVQRIAPSLIRPPNAAMWCLRHQQDMESILAATELLLDKSTEIFRKEWYDRGRTILADSKRAETLKAAAMQLKNLSAPQSSGRLMKGIGNKKSHHGRSMSGNFFQKDQVGTVTDAMAEWEILAVDRQIRDSITNLFTRDWQRVVLTNAPPRDGESYSNQRNKPRGISAGKTKSLSEVDTNSGSSSDQSQFVSSPPRMSHNRILPNSHQVPFSSSGSRVTSQSGGPIDSPKSTVKDLKGETNKSDPYDVTTPPHTPRNNNENEYTPPRSPPHSSGYKLSPRKTPKSPQRYADAPISVGSPVDTSRTPAPLSPVNSYRRQQDPSHQRYTSASAGTSPTAHGLYLRTLTSTAAERKRTVAACRALRAQITRFEEHFIKLHGRPPKGANERAPLATTYAQYREWKRAIRADAASRIQALFRGAYVRSVLQRNPEFSDIVRRRAGRPKKINNPHLSIPNNANSGNKIRPQPLAPVQRRDESVEVVMGPTSAWPKRQMSETSYDASSVSSSQYPSLAGASATSSYKVEMSHYTLPELAAQKRELKQDLKKYDMNFFNKHGRMPVKSEKEPIRHLYEKYNQLKNRLTAVERDPSLIQKAAPVLRRKTSPQQEPVAVSINQPIRVDNISSGDESPPKNINNSHSRTRPDQYKISTTPPGANISQDLSALKIEKQALHQMLRAYEKDFFKKYNRQVSSYADIRPVASQYRRYKEIKKSILALQPTGET